MTRPDGLDESRTYTWQGQFPETSADAAGVPLLREALDFDALRIAREWPTPNHMRSVADALDLLTVAKYGEVLRWFADRCDEWIWHMGDSAAAERLNKARTALAAAAPTVEPTPDPIWDDIYGEDGSAKRAPRTPNLDAVRRIVAHLWGEDIVNLRAAVESFANGWTVVEKSEPQHTEGGAAAGLDVDLLAKALHESAPETHHRRKCIDRHDLRAAEIATEYDRLAAEAAAEERTDGR